MVEFALILPLLIAVMLAIIDGAFLMQGYITVNHAAREAARFAVSYQPNQGDCMDSNGDGSIADEPWPYCPSPGYKTDPYEDDDDYYDRRVKLIKLKATEAALGLRMQDICNGSPVDSWNCIQTHLHDPGMYGVQVWGLPAFDEAAQEDHPGLQGLPVRVRVVHNVPLVIYGPLLSYDNVRVSASSEMINEGVQVGYGNQVPPTIPANYTLEPQGTPLDTVTPRPTPTFGPSPTPTPLPIYHIELNFTAATNLLPDEREHAFGARVTDPYGQAVAGAVVTFRVDEGSFQYSGTGSQETTIATSGDGWARTAIYANEPAVAHIRAWLDYDGDGEIDAEEPSDDATKEWIITAGTPYLIVSNHNPAPLDWIGVDVYDHLYADNPYSLWWCPVLTSTAVTERLAYPVNVESATLDTASTVAVQVPVGVAGYYRIESHRGDGGTNACGSSSTRAAYSALLQIAEVPPDLHIAAVTILNPVSQRLSGATLTITVEVENLAPVSLIDEPFDLDLYLNLSDTPGIRQLGDQKQWISDLGPYESTVFTLTVANAAFGENTLWAQVDTTDYIDEGEEGGEDNNTFGPLNFSMECGVPNASMSDDFNSGLGGQWTAANVGSTSVNGSTANSSGRLQIVSRGSTLWGSSDNFYYIYQPVEGDFDARLRIIAEPTTNSNAKLGLHVREFPTDAKSRFEMNMATHYRTPIGEQAAYRESYNGSTTRTSGSNNYTVSALPAWMRIVRKDNTYYYYYSTAANPTGTDWVSQGSHAAPNTLNYIGIAQASYNSSSYGTGLVDDFHICTEQASTDPIIRPPGLVQCSELIYIPGFEGNPATVFSYWKAGGSGAFSRTSQAYHKGSFSMRLHGSLGVYPCTYNILQPYLYQEVTLPTEVYSISTLTVDAYYRVQKSILECSLGGPDADDVLYLRLQDTSGADYTTPQSILTGGAISNTWQTVETNLTSGFNLESHAGETVRLYWNATHDEDYNGTFFYVDDVSAEVCTHWPIPDPVPGTASFGGLISTLGEYNATIRLPGADVWAYARGGEVYHTRAIQDGSYHFYNVPAGDYVIYAEAWVSESLRMASTQITVVPDERNYAVNLLLQ